MSTAESARKISFSSRSCPSSSFSLVLGIRSLHLLHFLQSSDVALFRYERRVHERAHELGGELCAHHFTSQAEHVHVVVLYHGGTRGSPVNPLLLARPSHYPLGLPPGKARLRPRRKTVFHTRAFSISATFASRRT